MLYCMDGYDRRTIEVKARVRDGGVETEANSTSFRLGRGGGWVGSGWGEETGGRTQRADHTSRSPAEQGRLCQEQADSCTIHQG